MITYFWHHCQLIEAEWRIYASLNWVIIGSDNGLSPGRRHAIIWTNAGILLIGPLGTNYSENLIAILTFSFTKMQLKESSAKWQPFFLGLSVLCMPSSWSCLVPKGHMTAQCYSIENWYFHLPARTTTLWSRKGSHIYLFTTCNALAL